MRIDGEFLSDLRFADHVVLISDNKNELNINTEEFIEKLALKQG